MYLKTLELQGFKSFPDKTVIEFDKGMTAIVGANGSGKSNISDAVRWVLGEMSAKSLRGNKMEDVIFNGSSKRKPATFAEVIMTIDNSDYLMKMDYDEVSVGRRLYRSGESEYYLNKKQVRLKDIVDLFLNTGIGREGYSVISQGKIAEIISLKGNERRELFEEAAGISRFRYRKHEAALKLESVSENAVRINDILSEVQGRIPHLEAQSAKAKMYLEISGAKRDLELGIWSRKMGLLAIASEKDGAALALQDKELQSLSDSINQDDARIDALYIENQEKNVQSEMLRGEISALASDESDATSRLSVLENEIHHFGLRKTEIESEGEKFASRTASLEEEKRAATEQLSEIQEEMARLEERKSLAREEQNQALVELSDMIARENALLLRKEELVGKSQSSSLEMKEDEGIGKAREERRTALEEQKAAASRDASARKEAAEKLDLAEKNCEAELKEAQVEDGRLNLEIYHLNEKSEELSELRQKCSLEKMEAEQRRDTLARMERLLEGFSDSVKEIMNASGKELQGICGPVSRLISTDEKYVTAVETALGGGIQNVIVEDERSAKEAIAFLKRCHFGRATFLPLTTVRSGVYRTGAIRHSGLIGVASDLCRFDAKYAPAIEFLLGRTLICDTIDSAAEIARGEKYGVKIVTLDGQVIHAGGSFTGGQTQKNTGVLSRSGDIALLADQIRLLTDKIASLDASLDELDEKKKAAKAALAQNESRLSVARNAANEAQNARIVENDRLHMSEEKLSAIEAELQELESASQKKAERALAFEEEIRRVGDELEQIASELAGVAEARKKSEEKKEKCLVHIGAVEASLAKAQVRLENAGAVITTLDQSISEQLENHLNKEKMLAELDEGKIAALAEIEEIKARREKITAEILTKRAAAEELGARIREIGEESAHLRTVQKDKINKKEGMMEAVSRLQSRLSGISRERDDILRSLAEEYEMTPESEEFLKAADINTDALGGTQKLSELRGKLRRIGPVNTDSVEELREAKERFDFLNSQYSDIIQSKEELEKLISDLEGTMRDMFSETFEQIRYTFRQIFTELFGGGSADIELTDKDDLLNCGVEIKVQPPGKVIKNLSLLSGGEQAFVAIALYMALLRINPSPFCIFDEIESALDEANVKRYAQYIKKHNDKTQFIVITHRRGTMEEADTLYGITMQEKGVSDFIRLETENIGTYASDGK